MQTLLFTVEIQHDPGYSAEPTSARLLYLLDVGLGDDVVALKVTKKIDRADNA